MKYLDCVEVMVEKEEYAKEGVHKGMQGIIWSEESMDGEWDVYFVQYGEKEDIAEIYMQEVDLVQIPKMDAKINELIKLSFEE